LHASALSPYSIWLILIVTAVGSRSPRERDLFQLPRCPPDAPPPLPPVLSFPPLNGVGGSTAWQSSPMQRRWLALWVVCCPPPLSYFLSPDLLFYVFRIRATLQELCAFICSCLGHFQHRLCDPPRVIIFFLPGCGRTRPPLYESWTHVVPPHFPLASSPPPLQSVCPVRMSVGLIGKLITPFFSSTFFRFFPGSSQFSGTSASRQVASGRPNFRRFFPGTNLIQSSCMSRLGFFPS